MTDEYFPKVLSTLIDTYAQPESYTYTDRDKLLSSFDEGSKYYIHFSGEEIVKAMREDLASSSCTVNYSAIYGKVRSFHIYRNDNKKTNIIIYSNGESIYSYNDVLTADILRMINRANRKKRGAYVFVPTDTLWYNIMDIIHIRIGHIKF
jgi:hypothetical protein